MILLVLLLELKDKLLARQELEAGRSIQKVLMPDENPKLSGWDIFLFRSTHPGISPGRVSIGPAQECAQRLDAMSILDGTDDGHLGALGV